MISEWKRRLIQAGLLHLYRRFVEAVAPHFHFEPHIGRSHLRFHFDMPIAVCFGEMSVSGAKVRVEPETLAWVGPSKLMYCSPSGNVATRRMLWSSVALVQHGDRVDRVFADADRITAVGRFQQERRNAGDARAAGGHRGAARTVLRDSVHAEIAFVAGVISDRRRGDCPCAHFAQRLPAFASRRRAALSPSWAASMRTIGLCAVASPTFFTVTS